MKKIPNNVLNAINEFINIMDYHNKQEVIGIIFYGSYVNGNFHDESDIDLHIIMSDASKANIRGMQYVNGFKIEYFEKTIGELYQTVDMQFETQNDAPVTMFLDGIVVFKSNDKIDDFRSYIAAKFSNGLPSMDYDEVVEDAITIESRLVVLKDFYEADNYDAFNLLFYSTLERIRKLYTRKTQNSYIPDHKIYTLYTDKEYLANYNKTIPDEAFVQMYLETINTNLNASSKLDKIVQLYEFSVKDIKFNSENYRIRSKKSLKTIVNV